MEDNNSLVIKAQHVYPESSRREIQFSFNAQSMTYHTYTQFNIDLEDSQGFFMDFKINVRHNIAASK